MKILSDFDGTLTDIRHEYLFEISFIQTALRDGFGISTDEFHLLYQTATAHIKQNPCLFGWFNNGRIAAFSDEDLFMNVAAAMTLLDSWFDNPPEVLASIYRRLPSPQFMQITENAHSAMNHQPLCEFNTPQPDAVQAITTLLDMGHEIVVASNSPASRIIPKFEFAGLHPVDHTANPDAPFRIRGNACKFVLGSTPRPACFGPRTIDVDHSEFRKIILEEAPDISIGDVFSLDLALPAVMAAENELRSGKIQLILRRRDYTPDWTLQCILNPIIKGNARYSCIENFTELLALVH